MTRKDQPNGVDHFTCEFTHFRFVHAYGRSSIQYGLPAEYLPNGLLHHYPFSQRTIVVTIYSVCYSHLQYLIPWESVIGYYWVSHGFTPESIVRGCQIIAGFWMMKKMEYVERKRDAISLSSKRLNGTWLPYWLMPGDSKSVHSVKAIHYRDWLTREYRPSLL